MADVRGARSEAVGEQHGEDEGAAQNSTDALKMKRYQALAFAAPCWSASSLRSVQTGFLTPIATLTRSR